MRLRYFTPSSGRCLCDAGKNSFACSQFPTRRLNVWRWRLGLPIWSASIKCYVCGAREAIQIWRVFTQLYAPWTFQVVRTNYKTNYREFYTPLPSHLDNSSNEKLLYGLYIAVFWLLCDVLNNVIAYWIRLVFLLCLCYCVMFSNMYTYCVIIVIIPRIL